MSFSRQQLKNGLLYALIGFFMVGGVYGYSVKNAFADDFTIPPTIPSGYTDYIIGCENGVNSPCTIWGISFFNSTNSITYGGSSHLIGSGDLVTNDTGSVSVGGYGHQVTVPSIDSWYNYNGCTSYVTGPSGCGFAGIGGGGIFDVTDGTTTNQDSMRWVASSRTIKDEAGNVLYVGGTIPEIVRTDTHFRSETISTTTRTITVSGYISPNDVSRPVNYSLNISSPIYPTWGQDSFVATTSGDFSHSFNYTGSFASTTIEQFTFYGQLYYFTGNPFSDASSTVILDTFSTTTAAGNATDFTAADIEQGIADNCRPFSSFWSVGLCIQYLVYPSTAQVTQNLNDIKQTFLTKMPMGYITRLVQIIAASTTTPLPVISYTWQSDSPLSGDTLSFDTGTYFAQAAALNSEMTSNTDHKTAWKIFEPLINIFLAIVLIFGMIHDISGLPLIHHKK